MSPITVSMLNVETRPVVACCRGMEMLVFRGKKKGDRHGSDGSGGAGGDGVAARGRGARGGGGGGGGEGYANEAAERGAPGDSSSKPGAVRMNSRSSLLTVCLARNAAASAAADAGNTTTAKQSSHENHRKTTNCSINAHNNNGLYNAGGKGNSAATSALFSSCQYPSRSPMGITSSAPFQNHDPRTLLLLDRKQTRVGAYYQALDAVVNPYQSNSREAERGVKHKAQAARGRLNRKDSDSGYTTSSSNGGGGGARGKGSGGRGKEDTGDGGDGNKTATSSGGVLRSGKDKKKTAVPPPLHLAEDDCVDDLRDEHNESDGSDEINAKIATSNDDVSDGYNDHREYGQIFTFDGDLITNSDRTHNTEAAFGCDSSDKTSSNSDDVDDDCESDDNRHDDKSRTIFFFRPKRECNSCNGYEEHSGKKHMKSGRFVRECASDGGGGYSGTYTGGGCSSNSKSRPPGPAPGSPHLFKRARLHGRSSEEIVEAQLKWERNMRASLRRSCYSS
jgi:hypothetical protein